MKLHVISTGSRGNCHLLIADDGRFLILDAGMRFKRILPVLERHGGLRNACGCLVTHEHKDHAIAVQDLTKRGVTCLMSTGTFGAIGGTLAERVRCRATLPEENSAMGPFTVLPFRAEHDAAEPFGFLVRHDPTGEQLLYATDTYFLRHTFPGVHYWMVECNYCDDLLRSAQEDERVPKALYDRLATSHMSLDRLKNALSANDLSKTRAIVLIHLSDDRSDEARMVREIASQTGVPTVAARDGMDVELSLSPF